MPLFICRWQNGDFSAVSAASRKDANALLDEVGVNIRPEAAGYEVTTRRAPANPWGAAASRSSSSPPTTVDAS